MFSQVSVCLSTGGDVCPNACWDTHPPGQVHPQAGTPLGKLHPPGQVHPRQVHTPPQVHPQAGIPPCAVHAGIWSTSGRYTSHWNTFLFELRLTLAVRCLYSDKLSCVNVIVRQVPNCSVDLLQQWEWES